MTVPRMILSGIYYRPDNHFKTSNDLKINYLNLYTDLGSLNQGDKVSIVLEKSTEKLLRYYVQM